MSLKIIKFPNPILRKKAKAVKRVTPEIVKLMDDMVKTMHAAPGVGLAAPQVNKSLRVIVVDVGAGPIALANPKITEQTGSQIFKEGCLCFPGVEAPVERASHIKLKGLDRDDQGVAIEADGFLATVFQHEVDHLEGIVFIDRVKDPSQIKFIPLAKEKKEELL